MSLRLTSSALALFAFAVPALAEVTPEEVWQSWLDYYQSSGYDVTEGSRDAAGDTLTLKDVTFSVDNNPEAAVNFTVPQIQLQTTGDGNVRTVYSDSMPISISGKSATGDDFAMTMGLSMPGNETVTSGSAGDMTHDFNFPTIGITIDKVKSGEKELADLAEITLTNTTGSVHALSGDEKAWDFAHKSENVAFKVSVDDDEASLAAEGTLAGLEATGKMSGAKSDTNMQENLAAALNEGLVLDGVLKTGDLSASFDFATKSTDGTPPQGGKGSVTAASSDLSFAMSKDGLNYSGNGGKVGAEISLAQLPFPISYGVESSTFSIQFPVTKSDADQPFKFAYSLAGLTIGDQIWDMLDPTRQLSRDPANLDVDLTGQLKVTQDILDPAFAAAAETMTPGEVPPTPFEPVEIVINQIAVKAVGASLEANGNLKPSEAAGMDKPVGELHVRFSGVAELVQTLAQMGLLPPDQVMGVNAMIGAFGKEDPSNPGVRTTDIEFKEGGSVFANGQQVQ